MLLSKRRASVSGLCAGFVVALWLAPAALSAAAAGAPVPDVSAIAQYVEVVPTSAGGTAIGAETPVTTPLPAATSSVLREQPGDAGAMLGVVATSSAYGAPGRKLAVEPDSESSDRALHPDRSQSPSVPSLGSIAMGGGSSTRFVGLIAVMAATAALVLGAAFVGKHRD